MKRILLITILSISTAAQAGPTSNSDFFFKPYIGADYDQVHINYQNGNSDVLEKNLNGGDIHIGAKVHQNLGFELGYLDTVHGTKDNVLGTGINTSTKIQGGTFDALGYLPVYDKIDLIGTVGVSVLKAESDLGIAGSVHKTETKPRLGVGAQYWLTDNLNARAIVRYQDADFSDTVDNAIVTTVGLNWQF